MNGIFEISKSSLYAPQNIKPRSCQYRGLNLHSVETQPIIGTGADGLLHYLRLSFLKLIKGLSLLQFCRVDGKHACVCKNTAAASLRRRFASAMGP